MKKIRILLIGNIKEDCSMSMKIYLSYLKNNLGDIDVFEPSCGKLGTFIYKNLVYPFVIPRGYDVYHIIDHSYAHLARFLPKNKVVITCHDLIPLKLNNSCSLRAQIFFRYYIGGMRGVKKIIADSQSSKNDIVKYLKIDQKKVFVIHPLSIDKKVFRKLNRKEIKKHYGLINKFVLLGIGSIFYKNTIATLRALKELIIKNPDIVFLKIGKFSKEEAGYIEKNGLGEFIIERPRVSEKEIVKLYNASDILVFPSLYEGFGIPPLEAMACKIPVISSNVSSLPEIVGDAAIQINPHSIEELKNAILKIKDKEGVKKNLIKLGDKNIKRFSKRECINKIKKLYEEVYMGN